MHVDMCYAPVDPEPICTPVSIEFIGMGYSDHILLFETEGETDRENASLYTTARQLGKPFPTERWPWWASDPLFWCMIATVLLLTVRVTLDIHALVTKKDLGR